MQHAALHARWIQQHAADFQLWRSVTVNGSSQILFESEVLVLETAAISAIQAWHKCLHIVKQTDT